MGVPDDVAGEQAAELARLDSRIECMTLSRDTVARYLPRLRPGGPNRTAGGGHPERPRGTAVAPSGGGGTADR